MVVLTVRHVFWTQQGSSTYELTALGPHAQNQARPNPGMERGVGHTVPAPGHGGTGDYELWERKTVFSKSVAPDQLTILQQKSTHPTIFGQHTLFI